MSHTTVLPYQWTAIHNGTPDNQEDIEFVSASGKSHYIPYKVVKYFVAEMIRSERIAMLEEALPDSILGID